MVMQKTRSRSHGASWRERLRLQLGMVEPAAARRIRAANFTVCLAFAWSVGWVLVAAVDYEFPGVVAINGAAAALYVGAYSLIRARRTSTAKLLFMATGWTQFLALTLHDSSITMGIHRWYLLCAVVPFLLYDTRYWPRCWIGAALNLSMLITLEYGLVGGMSYPLSPTEHVYATLNLAGTISTVAFVTVSFVREIVAAESRADDLLLNVLPPSVARQLRTGSTRIAERCPAATIVFADLVGFTPLAAQMSAPAIVELLNRMFSEFDDLAAELGLEKIKTIGDAYMVAGGVPERSDDHAAAAASMALGMCDIVRTVAQERGETLEIRVGVDSGPVVAGVIGKNKFSYDVWGDTVRHAALLESNGLPGRIHISDATKQLLDSTYHLTPRHDGDLERSDEERTYWLESARSVGETGTPV